MKGYLYTVVAAVGLSALSAMVSCSRESGLTLNDQTDSLSYVVGMNIAYNIMKMDSTLRPEVVCAAIDDALSGREMLSAEDAKTYFLAYMNYGAYERTRAYEEQYLSDLEKSDRDIVRTRSGLTYKVEELGDMNRAVTASSDSPEHHDRGPDSGIAETAHRFRHMRCGIVLADQSQHFLASAFESHVDDCQF